VRFGLVGTHLLTSCWKPISSETKECELDGIGSGDWAGFGPLGISLLISYRMELSLTTRGRNKKETTPTK